METQQPDARLIETYEVHVTHCDKCGNGNLNQCATGQALREDSFPQNQHKSDCETLCRGVESECDCGALIRQQPDWIFIVPNHYPAFKLHFWYDKQPATNELIKYVRADSVSPSVGEVKHGAGDYEALEKELRRLNAQNNQWQQMYVELEAERDSLRAALKSCLQQMGSAAGLLETFPDDYGEAINHAAALLGEQAEKNQG